MRAVRVMRQVAAVVGMGVLLVGFPPSARSEPFEAAAGLAAFTALGVIGCWTFALAEGDDGADADSYARRGWVVGAAGTYAADLAEGDTESTLRETAGSPVNFSLKNSFGLRTTGGYRCHRRVSAEVEMEWLKGFEGTVFEDTLGRVGSVDFEPTLLTTNAKGYILTGRYQPFLLFGGGLMTVNRKVDSTGSLTLPTTDRLSDFAMRFGGGIDFYATKHIVLTLETDYVLPFGDLDELDYLSIGWGLRYRF